tara:strand:+ start:558 stop:770 length:213 start_codon:yes stop_codon:yes gene_type:complete
LRADVWPENGDFKELRDQHTILRLIKEDLFVLFDKCQGDVQEFLKVQSEEMGMKFQYIRKAQQIYKSKES